MAHFSSLSDHQKGLLLSILGVLILTPDSLLVRLIGAEPFTLLVWRGTLQGLTIFAFLVLVYRGRAAAEIRAIGRTGLLLALVFTGSTLSFILALAHTGVADVLVIVAISPLTAALLSRAFLGETIPLRTWLAIGATLAGIALLVYEDLGSGSLLGDLAALGCALCIGASFTLTRHGRAVSMVPAMALAGAITAAVALVPALLLESGLGLAGAPLGYALIMGLLIVPLSFSLITLGPRYLPAAEVGLLMLLETVLGPLWVWLALDERPGDLALVGGIIVLLTLAGHSIAGGREAAARNRKTAVP